MGNKFSIRVGLKSSASNINTNHNVCIRVDCSDELHRDIILKDVLIITGVYIDGITIKKTFFLLLLKTRIESEITIEQLLGIT